MKLKYTLIIKLLVLSILLCGGANAQVSTGERKILALGCHSHDRTCYITIDGAAVGPASSCTSTSIRWSADTDANHNEMFTLFTAAFISGRLVNITLEDGCFSLQPSYPTVRYFSVN